MTGSVTHRAIEVVWRMESAKLIAGVARIVHDIGLAEDAAQDALVAALEQWPESGVPDNPGAWLMAIGKRRAIDLLRRSTRLEVIYLIFNQGYSATAGDDWYRPGLCEDALRLGRILAELAPNEPEVHGLVALMELQTSRLRARIGPSGPLRQPHRTVPTQTRPGPSAVRGTLRPSRSFCGGWMEG